VRVADDHQARARQIAAELAKIARTGMVLPASMPGRPLCTTAGTAAADDLSAPESRALRQ
jgi:hypothetical protein